LNRNNRSGKLEASERKKLDGNVLFKAGKFWQASKKYEKASLNAMKLKKINHHS
jgi:FK506-binding protein 4/5